MSSQTALWIVFNLIVAGLLLVDLKVIHRKAHAVSFREAAFWSAVWVCMALLFSVGIFWKLGKVKALEFLAGYVIEESLSVDNLFVFLMIFSHFGVPPQYQSRILHWGILGAIVMRFIMIFAGVGLIHLFHWIIYLFGLILIYTGIKMGIAGENQIEPEENLVLRVFKKFVPFAPNYSGQSFFIKDGCWKATPLFAALIVVEASDLVFAVDSIPAVLAITPDFFIVYTSNVFAILGLRALFFMLAGIMGMFRYLKIGLSVILCFVGTKMLLVDVYKIPIAVSLGVVVGVLFLSILASLLAKEKRHA